MSTIILRSGNRVDVTARGIAVVDTGDASVWSIDYAAVRALGRQDSAVVVQAIHGGAMTTLDCLAPDAAGDLEAAIRREMTAQGRAVVTLAPAPSSETPRPWMQWAIVAVSIVVAMTFILAYMRDV